MNNLEKANLKRWCEKREIDTAHIDNYLTYLENLKNLAGKAEFKYADPILKLSRENELLKKELLKFKRKALYWEMKAVK